MRTNQPHSLIGQIKSTQIQTQKPPINSESMFGSAAEPNLTSGRQEGDQSSSTTRFNDEQAASGWQDQSSTDVNIILTSVYLAIFVIGVVGNVCNCLVIADSRNKFMKTATNYYLFSLSVSDLLLLIFGLPHDLVNLWHPSPYLFNQFVCISRGWISEASTYASVLVIVAFTVERYLAICHPLKAHTLSRLSRSVKIIVFIWLLASSCALLVVMQYGVIMVTERLPNGQDISTAQCTVVSRNETIFELSVLIFFIIPMAVITILYVNLGYHLSRKTIIIKQSRQRQQQYHLTSGGGGGGSGGGRKRRPEQAPVSANTSSAQNESLLAENTCANSAAHARLPASSPSRTSQLSRPSSASLFLEANKACSGSNAAPEVEAQMSTNEAGWRLAASRLENWLCGKFRNCKPSIGSDAQAAVRNKYNIDGAFNKQQSNNSSEIVAAAQLQSIKVSTSSSSSSPLSNKGASAANNVNKVISSPSSISVAAAVVAANQPGQVSDEIEPTRRQSGRLAADSERSPGIRAAPDCDFAATKTSAANPAEKSQESLSRFGRAAAGDDLGGASERQQDGGGLCNQITSCQQTSARNSPHQVPATYKHLAGGNKEFSDAAARDDVAGEDDHARAHDQRASTRKPEAQKVPELRLASPDRHPAPPTLMAGVGRLGGSQRQQATSQKPHPMALNSTANKANMQSVIKMLGELIFSTF